jgi:ribosomal protein S24E
MSTRQDARVVLSQAMQTVLGRNPTDDEVKGFLAELNAAEKENPTVTTSTTDGGEQSSTLTTGGFNPVEYATDWAKEEYPKQARRYEDMTYEDMALAAIRGL